MSVGKKGGNLIFLISVPRSGSTLLQHLLGNSPEILALPEPWIALPGLYSLYTRKINRHYNTEYNRYWARTAIKDFVSRLPGGHEDILEGMRRMYSYYYERAMAGFSGRFFLDKGPRYFHIIPELNDVFPEATYIILLRNPLAVLDSMIRFTGGVLWQFEPDLLQAPRLLLNGAEKLGDKCSVIRYEDLLARPEEQMRGLCGDLGIDFTKDMLTYTTKKEFENAYGYQEQKPEYKSGCPDPSNADRWQERLGDPRIWRMTRDYLNYLGKEIFEDMGYPFDELSAKIHACEPGALSLLGTKSLLGTIRSQKIDYDLDKKGAGGLKRRVKKKLMLMAERI
jgi:hypothetical protein